MTTEDKNKLPEKPLLGEVLINRNRITPEQLNQALAMQKKEGGFLGEILENLGFIEDVDIVVALVVQCNFPYIAINKYEIDQGVIQLIPADFAKSRRVIPLDRVGNVLSIVMANPLDLAIKAEIQRITNCAVAPFIATRKEIQSALERWYGKEVSNGYV